MIDEPVENASDKRTKPNCGVVHKTISSANRERCVAQIRGARQRLQREIAVRDAVERICGRPVKAERSGGHIAVDREGCAGKRRGAERAFIEALARVPETSRVALQHFDISQEMVAESDGLCRLHMGEARHRHARAFERPLAQRQLQTGDLRNQRVDRVSHPKPEVERNLVVARARGVQPSRRRADDLGKPALDIHVNVFERAREGKGSRLDFAFDLSQTGGNGVGVGRLNDALLGEHCNMRLRAGNVLGGEFAVEVDRGVNLFHDGGRAGGEAAAPHRVAHCAC